MAHRSYVSLFDKLHVILIAGYVAFSGIFWFPGISYLLIANLKTLIFGFLAVIGLIKFKVYNDKQFKIYLCLGLGALCAFISNSITNNLDTAVWEARNYIEPLIWLIALNGLNIRAYTTLISRLMFATTLFFVVSLYPMTTYIGLTPNLNAPAELIKASGIQSQDWWLVDSVNVMNGGFSLGRTGWGAIVAPMSLFIISIYNKQRSRLISMNIYLIIILFGSLGSIIVTGARGGTFALLAVVLYGLSSEFNRRIGSIIALFTIVLTIILFVDINTFLPEFFLRRFDTEGDVYTRLNAITTGRLSSYIDGIRMFIESPVFGVGADNARIGPKDGSSGAVHNLWLWQLAKSGLFVGVPLFFLTVNLGALAFNNTNLAYQDRKITSNGWPNTRLVILCGLILAMVEPGVIIGSFNSNVVIWTAVWVQLSKLTIVKSNQFRKL